MMSHGEAAAGFAQPVDDLGPQELKGIAEGLKVKGAALDLWDVVALNAWLELSPYYTNWYDKQHKPAAEHCSAFVATGSYTTDGKIIIAHNNWSEYKEGSRWNVIFDITPLKGHRMLMDGMPVTPVVGFVSGLR